MKTGGMDLVGVLCCFLQVVASPKVAVGQSEFIPSTQHYLAVSRAKDCAVYRSLVHKAGRQLETANLALQGYLVLLHQRRIELEECAKNKNINARDLESGKSAVQLAEVCSGAYESWLAPGSRIQMVKQDMQSASEQLQEATLQLELNCKVLPPSQVVSAQIN